MALVSEPAIIHIDDGLARSFHLLKVLTVLLAFFRTVLLRPGRFFFTRDAKFSQVILNAPDGHVEV